MSSKISQGQRIASLLLKELHKFAGDLQAGHAEGRAACKAPCPGQAPPAGKQGGTGSASLTGAPPAAGRRREARERPAHLTSGTAATAGNTAA